MDSFSLTPGLVLLLGLIAAIGALGGALLALLGVWVWYTVRLVGRIARRGDAYLSDWDNEQARKIKLAYDLTASMEYQRQMLRYLDPVMARDFTREEPKQTIKEKGKKTDAN